jgi:hypothetical protein
MAVIIANYPRVVLEVTGSDVSPNTFLKAQYFTASIDPWQDIVNSDQSVQTYQNGFELLIPVESVNNIGNADIRLVITSGTPCVGAVSNTYNFPVLLSQDQDGGGTEPGQYDCTTVTLRYFSIPEYNSDFAQSQADNACSSGLEGSYTVKTANFEGDFTSSLITLDSSVGTTTGCTGDAPSGWYAYEGPNLDSAVFYWSNTLQQILDKRTCGTGIGEG